MHEKKNNFPFSQLTLAFFFSLSLFLDSRNAILQMDTKSWPAGRPFSLSHSVAHEVRRRKKDTKKKKKGKEKKNEAAGGIVPAKMLLHF